MAVEQIEKIDRLFGLAIANVLPGAVSLFGLSFQIPSLRGWFGFVAQRDASLAGFLFVVAGSAALGVMLSALGALLYERSDNARPKSHDHAERIRKEPVYQNLVSQHYHYYQCYRNTSVSVVIATVCYLTSFHAGWVRWVIGAAILIPSVLVLRWAALDAIKRFEHKRTTLLKSA